MTTFSDFRDLPPEVTAYLATLEDFIGNVDGKDTVTWSGEKTCFDDGTIDAEDAVRAFNGLVGCIRSLNLLRQP
jgi:hypothetical protein